MRSDLESNAMPSGKESQILVREVMTSPVVTAFENSSIKDIAKKMKSYDVDTVVIVNKENEPVGLVTEGDIVRRLLSKKHNLWFTKAKHVMSKPVLTTNSETAIDEIIETMSRKKIKRICVVDDTNKLMGIVTQTDILENTSYLMGLLREMLEAGYGDSALNATGLEKI
ncbi:MAG: cyclic nucleotide-binding/CBS domain-containing protein [Candidatus Micrarchaeia archaeon]